MTDSQGRLAPSIRRRLKNHQQATTSCIQLAGSLPIGGLQRCGIVGKSSGQQIYVTIGDRLNFGNEKRRGRRGDEETKKRRSR